MRFRLLRKSISRCINLNHYQPTIRMSHMNLHDDEIVFFEKINLLDFQLKPMTGGCMEEALIILNQDGFDPLDEPTGQQYKHSKITKDNHLKIEKPKIKLIRKFLTKNNLLEEDSTSTFEKHGLILDRDFFSFLRAENRIQSAVIKKKGHRVTTSLGEKEFSAEDSSISKAFHKCSNEMYPHFLQLRNQDIARYKTFFSTPLELADEMEIVFISTAEELAGARAKIESAEVLLIDLEGDNLGRNGQITLMQVNTYTDNICFLIDIKVLGDHELQNKDGWIRQVFESEKNMKIMWGGTSDIMNLWSSYDIHVKCFIDLQVVEQMNRHALIPHAHVEYSESTITSFEPISLELAYKTFTKTAPLLKFKENQASHKKYGNYHVWSKRPITEELMNYAAFDVASLRSLSTLFFNVLTLWKWTGFEASIARSRLFCEPRIRTCFSCLRTLPLEKFSKKQIRIKGSQSKCSECATLSLVKPNFKSLAGSAVLKKNSAESTVSEEPAKKRHKGLKA